MYLHGKQEVAGSNPVFDSDLFAEFSDGAIFLTFARTFGYSTDNTFTMARVIILHLNDLQFEACNFSITFMCRMALINKEYYGD